MNEGRKGIWLETGRMYNSFLLLSCCPYSIQSTPMSVCMCVCVCCSLKHGCWCMLLTDRGSRNRLCLQKPQPDCRCPEILREKKKRGLCVCLWASVWEKKNGEPVFCGQLHKTNENWKPIWREYKPHPHFLLQFTSPITHQQKKKTFLPLTKIAITRTGNILLCTKARMVSLHSLCSAFADTIFPFAIQKALVQQRVGGNNLKKIKCQTIWGKTLTTCQHYFQAVFPFFPVL